MSRFSSLLLAAFASAGIGSLALGQTVFVNEVHYDNASTDTGEAIEVAGPAGTNLAGWSLVLYNGSNGDSYSTINLSGIIPDLQNGYGVLSFLTPSLQNGDPDGFALMDGATVVQFLCYDGVFAADSGVANGSSCSTSIGSQSGSQNNTSLRLAGSGSVYTDFTWQPEASPQSFGAINPGQTFTGGPGLPTLSVNNVTLTEGNAGTKLFDFTVSLSSPAGLGGVTFDAATADGTATDADNDYQPLMLSGQVIPEGQTSATVSVTVNGDTAFEPDETFFLNVTNVTGATISDGQGTGTIANDECDPGGSFTLISAIQGAGSSSPLAGQPVTVSGIVTANFQGSSKLSGFFLQEESGDQDGDPATSEGIFVFTSSTTYPLAVGDLVRVTGTVTEFFDKTEINAVSSVQVCGTGTVTPTVITFPYAPPVGGVHALEPYEGMLVQVEQPLYVTENFEQDNFGELSLSVNAPLVQPTLLALPGAPALAQQDLNDRSRIWLNDSSGLSNAAITVFPYPQGGLSADNTARVGARVNFVNDVQQPVAGVLDYNFNTFRIEPTAPLTFTPASELRTATPDSVGAGAGIVRVVGANLLNYFTTFGSRGANNALEFQRQSDKLVAEIEAMNPHVLGVTEIENTASVTIMDLRDKLNAAAGFAKYEFINTNVVGTDQIRVAFLYQPLLVQPVGPFTVLQTTPVIPTKNRPPVIQVFQQAGTKGYLRRFTVAINHFKSKGSACDDADDPGEIAEDPGPEDGQGNCNLTRTSVAQELINQLAAGFGDPSLPNSGKILIIGDLNAYAMEDPIRAITDRTFTNAVVLNPNPNATYFDMVKVFHGNGGYSYNFDGQRGYLDHALASFKAAPLVTGVTEWHINSDEPDAIDYNTENRSNPPQSGFYAANPYRASDHDPVVIGFNPLCGDLDNDGDVDLADRDIISGFVGQPVSLANRRANYDNDGQISVIDGRIWLSCYLQYLQ